MCRDESCLTQFNPHTHPECPSDDPEFTLPNPRCVGMSELPNAPAERERVSKILRLGHKETPDTVAENDPPPFESSELFKHLASGLAYTIGSALGTTPPPVEDCLAAYQVSNSAGLTAGARAWSKHCHRSRPQAPEKEYSPVEDQDVLDKGRHKPEGKTKPAKNEGWWGTASGPIPVLNEKSLALFWKIMNGATWRNLHWLPHQVLVYEVRVPEGYGMRWARDLSQPVDCAAGESDRRCAQDLSNRPWIFRGFLEPQMENGHELGWSDSCRPPGRSTFHAQSSEKWFNTLPLFRHPSSHGSNNKSCSSLRVHLYLHPGTSTSHQRVSRIHFTSSNQVWYEDLTGSGVETISHIRENARLTIMFCAFEGPPRIVRLWGTGTVHEFDTLEYNALIPLEERQPGSRSVISLAVHKVSTSCGYSIPFFTFKAHRMKLHTFASKKEGKDVEADACVPTSSCTSPLPSLPKGGLKMYWKENNQKSIDGLPGLLSAYDSPEKFVKLSEEWGQDDESISGSGDPLEASPGRYAPGGLFFWTDVKLFLCFLLGWVACLIWTQFRLASPSVVIK